MTIRFSLRQLSVFLAVAEQGSTVGAGSALAMSQSAVSAALAELENVAGQALFDRHGRRLILNDAGRALRPRALALVEDAEGLARDFSSSQVSLRIAASNTIGNYVLPPLLARFRQAQGEARLDVAIGNTQDVLTRVSSFQADVGLIEGRTHSPDIRAEHWMDDEMLIVTAPGHPLTRLRHLRGEPERRRLAEADWLMREPGSGTRELVEEQLGPLLAPHARFKVALELGNSEAIHRTLLSGYGVSCLSRHVVDEDLASGRLIRLELGLPPLVRPFSIVTHRNKTETRGLALLREFLNQTTRLHSLAVTPP